MKKLYTHADLQEKIEIISAFAFEAGRAFENRVITFDLYNTINFEDLKYSAQKGGQLSLNGNPDKMLGMLSMKLDERKIQALKDCIDKVKHAIKFLTNKAV